MAKQARARLVEVVELLFAIRIITTDGKHLSASFLQPLKKESLIDKEFFC
jgi:hypothetical protein